VQNKSIQENKKSNMRTASLSKVIEPAVDYFY
jgi:hypothetical protein